MAWVTAEAWVQSLAWEFKHAMDVTHTQKILSMVPCDTHLVLVGYLYGIMKFKDWEKL